MALNYIVNFGDRLGTLYRIEIDNPDYTGDPIELIPSGTPLIISWEGNNDDDIFKTHVIPSNITIGVVSTGLDFDTLFYINDTSFKTRVYRAGVLYWSGYLISDGIQEIDSGVPFDVTLTAIDGLEFAINRRFSWRNYPGAIRVDSVASAVRSPIHGYRGVLFDLIPLPIKWNTSLKNDHYPDRDMLAGATEIDPYGEFYFSEKTAEWFLEELTKASQSWLYQRNAKWYINRYFDSNGYEIDAVTGVDQDANPVLVNDVLPLLATDVINESWYWSGKKPLGGVSIRYNNSRDADGNIIPNGNFSGVSLGFLMHWHFSENPDNGAIYTIYDYSLTSGGGNAVDLRYPTSVAMPNKKAIFTFYDYTTVDADLLFKDFLFKFTFLPLNGFTINNVNDRVIVWDNDPMNIKIEFVVDGKTYCLNEFGFWNRILTSEPTLSLTSNIPAGGAIRYEFSGTPVSGNYVYFSFNVVGTGVNYTYDGQYLVTPMDENGGFSAFMNNIYTYMSDELGSGWNVTRDANSITFTILGDENITDNGSGVYTGNDGINADGFMSISAEGTAIGDIINFQFQGKGTNNSDILFPKGKGKLKVSFMLKEGQRYVLDDVSLTVNNANDVYDVRSNNSPNTNETYTMGISSGWSGFMYSSLGGDYSEIHESELWNGGKTLTQLYGEAIMSVRNRPCRVFSGTIDRQMEWGLFSLMGHVYAPLSVRVNVKDMVTDVVGVEFAPSSPVGGYIVEHKSSEG